MSWQPLIDAILGPGGALVLCLTAIFFLWKLFREEQAENRKNFDTVTTQSRAIESLTSELQGWMAASADRESRRRTLT